MACPLRLPNSCSLINWLTSFNRIASFFAIWFQYPFVSNVIRILNLVFCWFNAKCQHKKCTYIDKNHEMFKTTPNWSAIQQLWWFLHIFRTALHGRKIWHSHLSCKKNYTPKPFWVIRSIFPVQTFDEFHIFFGQLEIKDVKILFQSLQFRCFRNDHGIPLNAPAKGNLGSSFLVLLSKKLEYQKWTKLNHFHKVFRGQKKKKTKIV